MKKILLIGLILASSTLAFGYFGGYDEDDGPLQEENIVEDLKNRCEEELESDYGIVLDGAFSDANISIDEGEFGEKSYTLIFDDYICFVDIDNDDFVTYLEAVIAD